MQRAAPRLTGTSSERQASEHLRNSRRVLSAATESGVVPCGVWQESLVYYVEQEMSSVLDQPQYRSVVWQV